MAGNGGKRAGAGRKKGKPNKSTADIKKLLDERVDFGKVIDKLVELAIGDKPDTQAIKLLLEYRWGKPPQPSETTDQPGKRLIIEYVNA